MERVDEDLSFLFPIPFTPSFHVFLEALLSLCIFYCKMLHDIVNVLLTISLQLASATLGFLLSLLSFPTSHRLATPALLPVSYHPCPPPPPPHATHHHLLLKVTEFNFVFSFIGPLRPVWIPNWSDKPPG